MDAPLVSYLFANYADPRMALPAIPAGEDPVEPGADAEGEPLLLPSELRYLSLAAKGLEGPDFMRATNWPLSVIRYLRRTSLEKLGAKTTPHAVAIAIRRGLI